MSSTLLGSAEFSTFEGHSKELIFNGWNIGFGCSLSDDTLFYSARLKKHFLSVAPTRSGKGAALIIPNLAAYRGSAIVIDPKGENAYMTAEKRRKMGQKTHILDPWGEVNRRYGAKSGLIEEIATFNPLVGLDPQSEHFSDDLAYIADALIINQGKDPHWDNSARELVAGLIAFCIEKYNVAASLPLVRSLLSSSVEEIAKIAQEAKIFGPDSLATRKLARFTSPESKENAGIISTALTQTSFLDSATLAESLSTSSFSFSELLEETLDVSGKPQKATIYLVLPVDKLYTYGRWLRLMISFAIRTVARNTRPLSLPVLFVLDEFGTIGKLPAVSQAVGLMAGLQMCIWVFVQDFIQLKRDYPDEWETFIANAGTVTAFNVMDQCTAEYLSRMLGQTTVERISVATAERRSGGVFSSPDPSFMSMKDQEFSRALMHPDEIRRMPEDRGLIINNGQPIIFYKNYYFKDPYFFKDLRSDPYFTDPKDAFKEIHKRVVARLAALEKKIKDVFEVPPKHFSDELEKTNQLVESWKYSEAEEVLSVMEKKLKEEQVYLKIKSLALSGLATSGKLLKLGIERGTPIAESAAKSAMEKAKKFFNRD